MISVESVTVAFHGNEALKSVSFSLADNSRTVLLGPNGAGKSTLIRTLSGLQSLSSGRIHLNGNSITLLSQSVGFPKGMAVKEILTLMRGLAKRPRPVEWLIETCSLESFLDQRSERLSGGQHRRLAIALSLIEESDLLILDEPTQALDQQSKQRLWLGIEQLTCAVLLCTHDVDEAERMADNLLILDAGELLYHGEKQQFLAQLQRYAVCANTVLTESEIQAFGAPLHWLDGRISAYCQQPEPIVRWLLEHDDQLTHLRVNEISLHEAVQQYRQGAIS